MNPDAARMNSMGPDMYQMNQSIQQVQNRDGQNVATQSNQALANQERMMDQVQSAESAQSLLASQFANQRVAELKNATTGNRSANELAQVDPNALAALIESMQG